jgi:hypothetical protein
MDIQFPKPYKRRYFTSRDINLGLILRDRQLNKLSGSIQSVLVGVHRQYIYSNQSFNGAITMNDFRFASYLCI